MRRHLKEAIRKCLHTLERPWDWFKRYVKRRWKLYKPIRILPFRGFGNRQRRHILGRVLEDRQIKPAAEDDSRWRNAKAMIRRLRTNEVAFCRLAATMFGERRDAEADSEGYFRVEFGMEAKVRPNQDWYEVNLRLTERLTDQVEVAAIGEILIPPEDAQFGVISDIDDTILESSASNLFQLIKMSLMNNALTRPPVEGAAALYRAFYHGSESSPRRNPVFYVSSSAWNLYDLFEEFLEFHDFPKGPILLRDLGIDSMKLLKSGHDHKLEKIRDIMQYYPSLPFVLIGDSGQRDAWLYRDVVREFPDRIATIYIHDVRESRREDVHAIARELDAVGVALLLIENALEAARHAASAGLIRRHTIDQILP